MQKSGTFPSSWLGAGLRARCKRLARRAALVAAAILCCGASPEALRQPSAAMEPAILVGDEFLVTPATEPRRGEIVVLAVVRDAKRNIAPASAHRDRKRDFDIKRIVALPGDTIAIEGGRVVLNSQTITSADAVRAHTDLNGRQSSVYREASGDRSYEVLEADAIERGQLLLTVPSGHVYVLGDNRDHSRDSRAFGPFPIEDVVGVVGEILASANPITRSPRPERAGTTPR